MKPVVRIGILVVVVALCAGGVAVWYSNRGDPGSTWRTAPVRRTDIVSTIAASGTVVPEDVVDVGAQINGQIAAFGTDVNGKIVDYRSSVQKDMLLAQIDETLFNADVATAQAQFAQAQAQVRSAEATHQQAQAKLDQAQRDWDRAQKLAQSPALSQVDFDTARSNFEQARANLALAEASIGQAHAQVEVSQASVQRAQRNLTFCKILSPVDGVILDRRVQIGQTVVASLSAPSLFLIAKDLRRMQVLVQVNEADIGHVVPGQPVTFLTDAYPDQTFQGEVRKVRLNATQTQNVVTYTVEIVTDNADLKLLPYLTANVTFEVARRESVLAVPNAALRWAPARGTPARDVSAPRETSRTTSNSVAAATESAPATAAGTPNSPSTTGAADTGSDTPAAQDKTATASESSAAPADGTASKSGRGPRGPGREGRDGGGTRDGASGRDSSGSRSGGAGRRSGDGSTSAKSGTRGARKSGTVWILEDGAPKAVSVRVGLSDGTLTEIETDQLAEGAEIIVGERVVGAVGGGGGGGAGAAGSGTTNPFAPPVQRGGGRGGR